MRAQCTPLVHHTPWNEKTKIYTVEYTRPSKDTKLLIYRTELQRFMLYVGNQWPSTALL